MCTIIILLSQMYRKDRPIIATSKAYCGSPLHERIVRTKHPGVPPVSVVSQRPLQHKLWGKDELKQACDAVKQGKSLRRAEMEFGVPRSTIHDHISGPFTGGTNWYLTDREETELVNVLLKWSCIGYARTRKQIFLSSAISFAACKAV